MAVLLPKDDQEFPESSEINVTPFIDVMLVLLIIFMVVAPLSTVSVNVDLPGSTSQPTATPEDPVTLTLDASLALFVNEAPVQRNQLPTTLDQLLNKDLQKVIFIQADKRVGYGDLMALLDEVRAAGYLNIALVGLESHSGQK
ncbi:TonB system transport protein ExbD [Litoribacillus peritrichatus]|uniref:Biopolymer transport protein ExbD n=1 Tax=Litoribacillus peritrichatus TaxID=718191 RepID=A0ABP7NBN3_9GAMM